MKIKRILSLSFILLFLTSTGCFSQLDFIDQTQTETGAQPNEDSENAVREFRESIKINVSGTVNTRPSNLFYAANQLIFNVRHHAKFFSYFQKRHSGKPDQKLFINFGSLIL